jgi:hypothetical protein
MKPLVVLLSFLRIRQELICLLNLFEALLGRGVTRIRIRVVFSDQLPVGLLDVILGSFSG